MTSSCAQSPRTGSVNARPPLQSPPSVAVIGAGYLGTRIAAELLLLGSKVKVFDRDLFRLGEQAGQFKLDDSIAALYEECDRQRLLQLSGVRPPERINDKRQPGPWIFYDGEEPARALCSSSITEAVQDVELVIEAVPDSMVIKVAVFSEAVRSAPSQAMFVTNTLSLSLSTLVMALADAGIPLEEASRRICGVRFMAPVLFIPFTEMTMTQDQVDRGLRNFMLELLARWGKTAFKCQVQGAVDGDNSVAQAFLRAYTRLRLDPQTAHQRQVAEARIRKAIRDGDEAMSSVSLDIMTKGSERVCCVCLEESPCARNMSCNHVVLCNECAELVEASLPRCPICRAHFARLLQVGG